MFWTMIMSSDFLRNNRLQGMPRKHLEWTDGADGLEMFSPVMICTILSKSVFDSVKILVQTA